MAMKQLGIDCWTSLSRTDGALQPSHEHDSGNVFIKEEGEVEKETFLSIPGSDGLRYEGQLVTQDGLVFTIKQEVDTDMFESLSSTEGQDPSTEQEMVSATIKQEDEEEIFEPITTRGEGGGETEESIPEEILLKSYTHPSDDESFNLRMSLSETSRRDEELGAASCQQTIDSKLNAIEAELLKMKDKVSRMETLLVELHKVVVERSKQTTVRGQPYEGNESLILIGDSEHAVHVDKRRFQRAVHLATSVHLTKQTTERGQPYKAVEGNESLILIGNSEYAVHVDKRRFQRAVHLANSGRALLLKLMSMVIQPDELGNFSYRGDRNMEPPLDSLIDDDRFKAIQLQVRKSFPCFDAPKNLRRIRDAVNGKCRKLRRISSPS
eukprot:XP_011684024.1 PREDICTED: uncharacterized protein LOC581412 isoform X5 [Strongylocentrotus purpuratus]